MQFSLVEMATIATTPLLARQAGSQFASFFLFFPCLRQSNVSIFLSVLVVYGTSALLLWLQPSIMWLIIMNANNNKVNVCIFKSVCLQKKRERRSKSTFFWLCLVDGTTKTAASWASRRAIWRSHWRRTASVHIFCNSPNDDHLEESA